MWYGTRRSLLVGAAGGCLAVPPIRSALGGTEWRRPGARARTFQTTEQAATTGTEGPGTVAGDTTAADRYVPQGYTVVFQDDFDRLDLLPPSTVSRPWLPYWARWNVRYLAGNQDRAIKYADAERLADGRLVGQVLRASGRWGEREGYLHEVGGSSLKLRGFPLGTDAGAFGGFPYVAAMISGERVHAQRWGYWQVRMRVNRLGRGHHLAVWLLPIDGSWPPEIDMVEIVGQDPSTFYSNAHGSSLGLTSYRAPNGAFGWHTFGFEWTTSTMRWTCDGQVVREQPSYFADKDMYFLISWEIGSKWPGSPDTSTPWPAEVEIDHVRIYRRA